MPIIIDFETLESLNNYWEQTFTNLENCTTLNPIELREYFAGNVSGEAYSHITFTPELTSSLQTNNYTHYYYSLSKTNYRKNIHPNIPDSLFKRLFNSLKQFNYIIDYSTSYVILVKMPMTQEVFDLVSQEYSGDIKSTLNTLLDKLDSADKDTQFYLKKIFSLEEKCNQLIQDVADANQRLVDKNITSWY